MLWRLIFFSWLVAMVIIGWLVLMAWPMVASMPLKRGEAPMVTTIHRAGNCGNCKFGNLETTGALSCRRYPPKMEHHMIGHDGSMVGDVPNPDGYDFKQIVTFPTTFAELWCGEHTPRIEGLS